MIDWIAGIPEESFVKIWGTVQISEVKGCSLKSCEILAY